jgi:hypothetical protein
VHNLKKARSGFLQHLFFVVARNNDRENGNIAAKRIHGTKPPQKLAKYGFRPAGDVKLSLMFHSLHVRVVRGFENQLAAEKIVGNNDDDIDQYFRQKDMHLQYADHHDHQKHIEEVGRQSKEKKCAELFGCDADIGGVTFEDKQLVRYKGEQDGDHPCDRGGDNVIVSAYIQD